MKRKAVFPGSFDPVTIGHQDIVLRALPLFDEVIVALGINTTKQSMFSVETRLKWLDQAFGALPNVKVESYEGLTVDFCKKRDATHLIRGLRNGTDFDYERTIAMMNKTLNPGIETVLLFSDPACSFVQSAVVREILRNKGDVSHFVPSQIKIS